MKEIKYLNVMKAFSCFAIVILHTVFYAYSIFQSEKIASVIIRNSFLWAVPCFVMISGTLLLNPQKEIGYEKIFKKYIPRMLIALVVFTIIFAAFDFLVLHQEGGIQNYCLDVFNAIFGGKGWSHMWYLYLMICIYLLLPLFRGFIKSAKEIDIIYILIIFTVFLVILKFIEKVSNYNLAFYICISEVFPLYFIMGYAIHNNYLKLNMVLSVDFIIIGTVILWVLSWFDGSGKQASVIHSLLNDYSFPATVLQSIGVYGLFKNIKGYGSGVFYKICKSVANCSLGIYLLHMVFVKYIYQAIKFNPYNHGGILMTALISIIIFALSWGIIRLLKFIPVVKKII